MRQELRSKLHGWWQHLLEQEETQKEEVEEIEVMVRIEEPLSKPLQDKLHEAGYRTRFVAGNISSGSVSDIKQLEKVAELPFVRKIELSYPLYIEKNNTEGIERGTS